MARRIPTIALVLCLTGCASTAPAPGTQPARDSRAPVYLNGISGESSIRIDRVRGNEVLGPDTAMKNGLIAGDNSMHVAAALSRSGEFLTLDLIVLNHADRPLVIRRSDITMVDRDGRWLTPVNDWVGASEVGLRNRARTQEEPLLSTATAPLGGSDPRFGSGPTFSSVGPTSNSKSAASAEPRSNARLRANDTSSDPMNTTDRASRVGNVPATLRVASHEGRSYWAYWQAEQITFPVTAFLMLDNRHVVFEFGE